MQPAAIRLTLFLSLSLSSPPLRHRSEGPGEAGAAAAHLLSPELHQQVRLQSPTSPQGAALLHQSAAGLRACCLRTAEMTDGSAADRALTHPQAGPPRKKPHKTIRPVFARRQQGQPKTPLTDYSTHFFYFYFFSSFSMRRTSVSHPAERTAKSHQPGKNNEEGEGESRVCFRQ